MAFDYKQYQQKRQNAIDFSKFLPTGENLDKVSSYIKAEQDKKKQAEIDKIMADRQRAIKQEMAGEGVYTSLFKNAWQGIKSGDVTRDIFSSIKSGISKTAEDLKSFEINPFKGLEKSGIEKGYVKTPESEIRRNPLLDKKNVLPQVGTRLYDEYSKTFGKSATSERETDYAKKLTKKQKDEIRKDWQDFQTENPELSKSILAEEGAKTVESAAKVATAPVRFTAGGLATGLTSYALEKADSDLKYTPKTDAEKLLIGETDIQRLTKQEDIYGTVARAAGVPTALILMAVLENPFMAETGLKPLMREGLEKAIKRQSAKTLAKMSPEQVVKIADELIEKELKAGKIEKEAAEKAATELKKFRVLEVDDTKLLPPGQETVKTGEVAGEGFVMKEKASVRDIKVSKLYNDYKAKLDTFNQSPTPKNLESLRISRNEYFNAKNITAETPIQVTKKTTKETAPKTIEQQAINYNSPAEYIKGIKSVEQPAEVIEEFSKKYSNLKTDTEIEQKLTEIWNKAKEAEKVSKKESIDKLGKETVEDGTIKTAKLARETALKADELEKTIGKNFQDLAGYTSRKVKAQAEKTAKLINEDISSVREMIRGEKDIPDDISPAYLWQATERYARESNDLKIMKELYRSKLSSGVSQAGSELRMIAEREADSPAMVMREIRDARAKKAKPLSKRSTDEIIAKERKSIQDKIRYETKKAIKVDDWKKFIDEIRC